MSYRIERDPSASRKPFEAHTYLIYDADRLVARYWHDHRGDDHGIEFVDGHSEDSPVGRTTEFLEGGGPEPLRLSDPAVTYLNARRR